MYSNLPGVIVVVAIESKMDKEWSFIQDNHSVLIAQVKPYRLSWATQSAVTLLFLKTFEVTLPISKY